MSIRLKLALSFLVILALFGLNLGIYFWGSSQREASIQTLSRAVERQLLVLEMQQELEERRGEAEFSDVLLISGARRLESEQVAELVSRLDEAGRKTGEFVETATDQAERTGAETFARLYQRLQ